MKLAQLLSALGRSANRAADDTLLEALRLGTPAEQMTVLAALIERNNAYAHGGVLGQYEILPKACQEVCVRESAKLYHALSECGRSPDKPTRIAVIHVIAAAKLGKLGYVLSENLRDADEQLSGAACEALLDMARWVNRESRLMHRFAAADDDKELTWVGDTQDKNDSTVMAAPTAGVDLASAYQNVMKQRPEIESAVARALDWVRTRHLADLMRAALLLCDHPQSRILAILKTSKHGGQASMVRKLQQPPAADHVEAFLLGASHGHLRTNFGVALAQVSDPAVFDAMLRRTHWLHDNQLRTCVHHVSRGIWWDSERIDADLARRKPREAARIADWITASGLGDADQDDRLLRILAHGKDDPYARLLVLRRAAGRPRLASTAVLAAMLDDADERFVRIAARELIRRRPPEYENLLLRRMMGGAESVRRVIGRAVGHTGFSIFWNRFESMTPASRKPAGRAMLKLVPDAPVRLGRYLAAAPEDCVRAMQIIGELGLAGPFRDRLERLCTHANPRIRSKAAGMLIASPAPAKEILDKLLADADPRVRANAIEVVDKQASTAYVAMLSERARSTHGRERANAIKALHGLKIETAAGHLAAMLQDTRAEHRVSALWALRQAGVWALLREVGRLAQSDDSPRVRRYAVAMLKGIIAQAGSKPLAAKVA